MTEDQLSEEERSQVASDPPPTLLEWSVRGLSLALVVGLLGFLVYAGLQPNVPPSFQFEVRDIERRGDAWVVPVVVTNAGDVSVTDLQLVVEIVRDDGSVLDAASVEVGLLGNGASVETEFWVGANPTQHAVRFDVGGYEVP